MSLRAPLRLIAAPLALLATLPAAATADPMAFTCEAMAAAIGAPVTEMEAAPNEGWVTMPEESRLVCSWLTAPADKTMQGQQIGGSEYQDFGNITAQIAVTRDPLTREAAGLLNAAHDVPEALAPEGAWLFDFKPPQLEAPLSLMTPQLMYGDISVNLAYGSAFNTLAVSLQGLTVDWSIKGSARILAAATAE